MDRKTVREKETVLSWQNEGVERWCDKAEKPCIHCSCTDGSPAKNNTMFKGYLF